MQKMNTANLPEPPGEHRETGNNAFFLLQIQNNLRCLSLTYSRAGTYARTHARTNHKLSWHKVTSALLQEYNERRKWSGKSSVIVFILLVHLQNPPKPFGEISCVEAKPVVKRALLNFEQPFRLMQRAHGKMKY